MTDPLKKTYAQEMKDLFLDFLFMLAIFAAIWVITDLFSAHKSDYPRQPTPSDYEKWNQQYEDYGNNDPDISVNQQYGGR